MADHFLSPERHSTDSGLARPSAAAAEPHRRAVPDDQVTTPSPWGATTDDRSKSAGPKGRELSFVMTGEGALVFGARALGETLGFAEGDGPSSLLDILRQEDTVAFFATLSQLDCGLAGRTRIRLRVRDSADRCCTLVGTAQAEYGGAVGRSYFLRYRLER